MQFAAAYGKCGPGSKTPAEEWRSIKVFYPEDRERLGEEGFLKEVKRLGAVGIAVVSKGHYKAKDVDKGWGAKQFAETFRIPETVEVQVWGMCLFSSRAAIPQRLVPRCRDPLCRMELAVPGPRSDSETVI